MSKVSDKVQRARREDGGAFIPYLMAGDPTPEMSLKYIKALGEGGADVIELGVPFSDPVADGQTIQAAGTRALDSISQPRDVLNLARKARQEVDVPIILMSYYNPIFQFGPKNFLQKCEESGVNGLILPDLPIGEGDNFLELAKDYSVEIPLLATPRTGEARLNRIVEKSTGFLYLVAHPGTTGARSKIKNETTRSIVSVKSHTHSDLPVCVGFGLSSSDQVAEVIKAGADGAIVGSAIVNRIGKGVEPALISKFAEDLKNGTRQASKNKF